MMMPFPLPLTPPSSASLNATASLVPFELNSRAEMGDGYLGNWRRRFLASGSQIETVQSPPPVAKVPWLYGNASQCMQSGRIGTAGRLTRR